MKKVVLKVELHDEKCKKKAMKKVSGISGVNSISIDTKEKKLTVIGETDVVEVVKKLRKICPAEIISVGPAKEPAEKKKEEAKKPEEPKKDPIRCMMPYGDSQLKNFKGFNPQTSTQTDTTTSDDDDSKWCVIC